MSLKFWLCVTVVSVALAHTYVYTDILWRGGPRTVWELPRFFPAIQFNIGDAWRQVKAELKSHLEVGQQAAEQFRVNIAQFRDQRLQLRIKRKLHI